MNAEEDVVRLEHEARDVWLVKVPPSVARLWDGVTSEDALLGRLRIHTGQKDGRSLGWDGARIVGGCCSCLCCGGNGGSVLETTTDFNLQFNDKRPDMRIFSQGDGGVEMQGTVEHAFFMQPLRSDRYEAAVQRRVRKGATRHRVTKEIDGYEALRTQKKSRVITLDESEGLSESDAKRRKISAPTDDASMREALFELFARRDEQGNRMEYWPMRDIRVQTGASEALIKRVLAVLCIFHRDGKYILIVFMGLLRCVPAAGCLGRRARGSTGKAPQRLSEPRPEQDAALEEGQEVQHGEQERKAHEDADNDTELTELALADAPQPAEVGEPCKAVETGAVAAELEPQDAQEESPRDAGEPGAEKEQSQADAQPECEVQDDVAVLEHTDSADDGGDGPTSASGWDRIKDLVMPRGEKQAGVAVNSSHGERELAQCGERPDEAQTPGGDERHS
ncbi:Hypothetical protein SCF082_LOCUS38064 [Durusdinium trenchii]|uniref:Transcription initiation factor IIF subunit beta n=1 Tax=Durusdinium trenchii TaxID=1381693 RepID=A0ABP0PUQ1_9DINO